MPPHTIRGESSGSQASAPSVGGADTASHASAANATRPATATAKPVAAPQHDAQVLLSAVGAKPPSGY